MTFSTRSWQLCDLHAIEISPRLYHASIRRPRATEGSGKNQRNAFSRPRENFAICVAGVGATKPFSTLVTDIVPDLELVTKGQCFPRYAYERIDGRRDA